MQLISFIIANSGDGSNHLVWFDRNLTYTETDKLNELDCERFGSGDVVQLTVLEFPEGFDVIQWANTNHIKPRSFEYVLGQYQYSSVKPSA